MAKEEKDSDPAESSDVEPEVHLAGLRELREVVENSVPKQLPTRASLQRDAVSGLTVAVSGIPDGMAGGLLAGVNPLYGLYANMIGPFVGGIFSSTQRMIINNTGAVSLVAGQSLVGVASESRESALFLMVVLTGIIAIICGIFKLGRLTRFVSYSVMTGFLAGIAVVLILSQLPTFTGIDAEGSNQLLKAFDLLRDLETLSIQTLGIGAITLATSVTLRRTKLAHYAGLLAVMVASSAVAALGLDDVQLVHDIGEIPQGLPEAYLPSFRDSLAVLTGAFSVAIVVLVQGAGVSQSVPNRDGSRRRMSRDFIAQGVANVASGFFRGLPVGGSVSGTALNVASGAVGRSSALLSGLWIALILIAFPDIVGYVAMPSLGALLIHAGFQSLKPADIDAVWDAGWPARVAGITTFSATLVLPIQAAVGIGVAVSTLLFVTRASADVSVRQVEERPDGHMEEHEPPEKLASHSVTILDVYGQVFYAGAKRLEGLLPSPGKDTEHPVVILRLRGRQSLGATVIEALAHYAKKLGEVSGRLYLTGLSDSVFQQVTQSERLKLTGPVHAYEVTPIIGQSTKRALADAKAWLIQVKSAGRIDLPNESEGSAASD